MSDAERQALWAAEIQEQTARGYAEAACLLALRSGASRDIVRRALAEQAACLTAANAAPDDPNRSIQVMAARKRRHAQTRSA